MDKKKIITVHIIPQEVIEQKIVLIRGKKVMLDRDLSGLYDVPTRRLNEQVKRNIERFPEDFMFQLSKEEFENWKSQNAISNSEKMGLRRRPYAFTEQGVAMLSSVLNSKTAIQVNIQIMRTFTKFKEAVLLHKDLRQKIEDIERKCAVRFANYDCQFIDICTTNGEIQCKNTFKNKGFGSDKNPIGNAKVNKAVFDAIKGLLEPLVQKPKRKIGFHTA